MTLPDVTQSQDCLQRCYEYAGPPDSIDPEAYVNRSLDWKILHYGAQARNRVFCQGLFPDLAQLAPHDATAQLTHPRSRTEYIWFLFGHKKWWKLFRVFDLMPRPDLAELPPHVFDLGLMAAIRLDQTAFSDPEAAVRLMARIDRLCLRLRNINPDDTTRLAVFQAVRTHIAGNAQEARRVFQTVTKPVPCAGALRAIDTIAAPSDGRQVQLDTLTELTRADRRRVILVSLNRAYFDRYLERLVRSLCDLGGRTGSPQDWGLHLHCVGFEPPVVDWLNTERGDIGITVDRTSIRTDRHGWEEAYCASARYLFAPRYLDLYDEIFVCDVDGVFAARPTGSLSGQADVRLFARHDLKPDRPINPLPWDTISAASIVFGPTPAARSFAQQVSGHLAAIFQNADFAGTPWYADQSALFYSILDAGDTVQIDRMTTRYFRQANNWRQFFSAAAKEQFTPS